MAAVIPSRLELEKLKIPELKKLCKDNNITGYSKLNKKDLIEKLVASGTEYSETLAPPNSEINGNVPSSTSSRAPTDACYTPAVESISRTPNTAPSSQTALPLSTPICPPTTYYPSEAPTPLNLQARAPSSVSTTPPCVPSPCRNHTAEELSRTTSTSRSEPNPRQTAHPITLKAPKEANKRKTVGLNQSEQSHKKQRKADPSQSGHAVPSNAKRSASSIISPNINTGFQSLTPGNALVTPPPSSSSSAIIEAQSQPTTLPNKDIETSVIPSSKPPRTGATTSRVASAKRITTKFTPLKTTVPMVTKQSPVIVQPNETPEKTLDFPLNTPIDEIKNALKDSFLERLYHANKTSAGVSPQHTTGMSFDGLGSQMLDGTHPIQAINTAIRFVIARIHTTFQLGESQDPVSFDPVIACHEYCNDISIVFTHNGGTGVGAATPIVAKPRGRVRRTIESNPVAPSPRPKEPKLTAYLVISETGDVITRSDKFQMTDMVPPFDLSMFTLRADWNAYFEKMQIQKNAEQTEEALISHVKTKQSEDYPSGIALVWRKRMRQEGKSEELSVAERYILGNVMLNSVSGELFSTMQMDSIWTGQGASDIQPKNWKSVALYLPESHQVESISFNTSVNGKGSALHPSVAITARKNGEDLILRPTGQIIGDTDRGVDELYQHMLGCDHRGVAVDIDLAGRMAQDFWRGSKEPPCD